MSVTHGYFHTKPKEKRTKITSFMWCLIPHILNVYTWKLEILVMYLQLLLRHPSKQKKLSCSLPFFLRYTCIYPVHLNSQVKVKLKKILTGLLYPENYFALFYLKATSKFPSMFCTQEIFRPVIRYNLLQI